MVVRQARQADIQALCRVHTAAIRGLAKNAYTEGELRAWCGCVNADLYAELLGSREIFVAERNGRVIGFCQLDLDSGEVEATYVDPHDAGHGVGSQLLEAAEKIACDRGLRDLHLGSSVNAEPFYRKHGFAVRERSTFPGVKDVAVECVIMTKHLLRNG